MDEKEIVIVTAFFPISRESWKKNKRSDEQYFEYFKFWSGIRNDLIVYTTPEYVEKVKNIRDKNIEIIEIENINVLDEELYKSIKEATENKIEQMFRLRPFSPESWNYDYNYVMTLKTWFLCDAVKRGHGKGIMAWIDFGYNHGTEYYLFKEEFQFKWKYPFSEKIHIFNLHELNTQKPIFEICRNMDSYIIGSPIVVPDNRCEKLYQIIRENMISLNRCGLVDDDQTLMLMAYRQCPEEFEVHKENWNTVFKHYGNAKLTLNPNFGKRTFRQKIKQELGRIKRVTFYSIKWYRQLLNEKEKV